ncbi:hypothetical protein TNCT_52521 [Trichonephila clavata]|uniref:Uncharacterized protein n=1 Tax=Trichonephila clavata TaxID=2740835 RepID=A0A8X6KIP7_TRICU|nr:hypothetical protein TNCT_52521 [Trichonephila clavata]
MTIVPLYGGLSNVISNLTFLIYSQETGIMVWEGISFHSGFSLVMLQGKMTFSRYMDDIVQSHVISFLAKNSNSLFRQDNAQLRRLWPSHFRICPL